MVTAITAASDQAVTTGIDTVFLVTAVLALAAGAGALAFVRTPDGQ
jgi:hypothetical protein